MIKAVKKALKDFEKKDYEVHTGDGGRFYRLRAVQTGYSWNPSTLLLQSGDIASTLLAIIKSNMAVVLPSYQNPFPCIFYNTQNSHL